MKKAIINLFVAASAFSACMATSFNQAPESVRQSIIKSITKYPSNTCFSVFFPSRNRKPLFCCADRVLPHAWKFGFRAGECIVDSRWADGKAIPKRDKNLIFVYSSSREQKLDMNDHSGEYIGTSLLSLSICKIFFMVTQDTPIWERYDPEEMVVGGVIEIPLEKFWREKGVDRENFLRQIASRAFVVCDGGAFSVDYPSARKIIQAKNCSVTGEVRDDRDWRLSEDINLNGREISEIVYWLWNRDGKGAKYSELCRRNPELFEPISKAEPYKTEIGRALAAAIVR